MLKSRWLMWTVRHHNSVWRTAAVLTLLELLLCACVVSPGPGASGSRGVEFVRNPRPKSVKNSLRQVSATPQCYVWLIMWRVLGWAGFCPVPSFPHAFLQASCFLTTVQKLLAKIKLNTDSPWFIMLSWRSYQSQHHGNECSTTGCSALPPVHCSGLAASSEKVS